MCVHIHRTGAAGFCANGIYQFKYVYVHVYMDIYMCTHPYTYAYIYICIYKQVRRGPARAGVGRAERDPRSIPEPKLKTANAKLKGANYFRCTCGISQKAGLC